MSRRGTWLLVLLVAGAMAAIVGMLLGGPRLEPGGALERGRASEAGSVVEGDPGQARLSPASGTDRAPTPEELAARRAERQRPAFPSTDGIFGAVLDAHGAPIAGALVKLTALDRETWGHWAALRPDPPPLATAQTDEEGAFLVGPAPAGALRIRAEAEGYAPTVATVSQRGCRVDLVLDRGGRLEVTVKDREGRLLPGATVLHQVGSWRTDTILTQALTNEEGQAVFDALPSGSGVLTVTAPGHASLRLEDLTVAPGETERRTVVLPAPLVLEGRVLASEAEEPIAGATLWVEYPWQPWLERTGPVTTDETGSFETETLAPSGQNVVLLASHPERASTRAYLTIQDAGDGRMTTEVRLPRERGDFTGQVVGADGQRVAAATVTFLGGGGGWEVPETRSRSDGSFEIAAPDSVDAQGGSATLIALAPGEGLGVAWARLPARGQAATTVTIRLSGAGRVEGVVVDAADQPVSGAFVSLTPDGQAARERGGNVDWMLLNAIQGGTLRQLDAVSAQDGRFAIEDVPAATFRLSASYGLDRAVDPESITVSHGATVQRRFVLGEGKTIEGTIRDTEGRGIAGATVNARPQAAQMGRRGPAAWVSTRSLSDGRFVLLGVSDGEYLLQVSAVGFKGGSEPSVVAGTTDVEILLAPLGWIEGQVELDGRGYPGTFTIEAAREGDESSNRGGIWRNRPGNLLPGNGSAETFSPDDGTFLIRGLEAGAYDLRVTTPEGWVSAESVRVDVADGRGSRARLRLTRGARVEGRLIADRTGEAVPGASISLRAVQESGEAVPKASARTDAEGHFSLRGLGAGSYLLGVWPPSGTAFEVRLDLLAGEARSLTLREEAPGAVRVLVARAGGRPLEGAEVTIHRDTGTAVRPNWRALQKEGLDLRGESWRQVTQTDADGTNLRRHLAPGRYRIGATLEGMRPSGPEVWVDVRSGQTAEARVVLEPATADAPDGEGR